MAVGKAVATGAALAALLGLSGPSTAGGYSCRGQAVACYEKVRLPDIYKTVERPVVLRPATERMEHVPPVIGRRLEREVIAHGRVYALPLAPVYSAVVRRELVQPGSVAYRMTPPVVRTVHEDVVVRPGRTRWVHQRDRHGREIKCLEKSAPLTRTVARQVIVDPGRRVPVFTPPVYADVPRTVLVRPAGVRHVYEPPVTRVVERMVVLRPAQARVWVEPPIYGVARHTVKVRSGGVAWRQIH